MMLSDPSTNMCFCALMLLVFCVHAIAYTYTAQGETRLLQFARKTHLLGIVTQGPGNGSTARRKFVFQMSIKYVFSALPQSLEL